MTDIVRQPRSLPSFAYQKMAEGARFENPDALETIDTDLASSFQSISHRGIRGRGGPDKNPSDTIVLPHFSHINSMLPRHE